MQHEPQDAAADDEVLFEERGAVGIVTLNRPKALNALTLGMVRALTPKLLRWAQDPRIAAVIVRGAGGRAFCAGGDIRLLYDLGKAGRFDEALVFWRDEYRLNRLIKRFPKPYVSLIDGIVMGGGVGLSAHGTHRVAGERYLFAMPEVGIGFFPDVGATYVLPRLPGLAGLYLALTGARIGAGDALRLGLASHAAPVARFEQIIDRLAGGEPVDLVLGEAASPAGNAPLDAQFGLIDDAFSGSGVVAILARLDALGAAGSTFATDTAATIRTKSPTSLALAFQQMVRGRDLPFDEAMALEFRIVSRIGAGTDFYEGVRAVLIDRDNAPRWSPSTIEAVDDAVTDPYFAPLAAGELQFDDADANIGPGPGGR